MAGGAAAHSDLPDTRSLISQYLLVLGTESLSRLITSDGRSAVIYCLAKTDSVEWAEGLFARLRAVGDGALPPGVRLRVAGGELAQAIANNDTVVREKLKNMLQVSAVIFLLSALVFRSFVGGLLVLAPLVCAAMVNLGVMGWAGSPLSFATATYTSMGVSLGADFAIYLLFRIREELNGASLEESVVASLSSAGQAVVFVASAIAAGYAALMLSDFALWRELGAYVGLMMLASAVCTITLLPAIVLLVRPRFLSDGKGAATASPPAAGPSEG
jgi:predicted RND superfamily exporter protein